MRISLRKGNFWQCQKVKLILLFWGSAPVPCRGPRQPPNPLPVEGPPAPIPVYFQNISTYFKSYWQPWFTEISGELKWGKDTGRQLENPPYHICSSSDTQQLRSPWKFSKIHWSYGYFLSKRKLPAPAEHHNITPSCPSRSRQRNFPSFNLWQNTICG